VKYFQDLAVVIEIQKSLGDILERVTATPNTEELLDGSIPTIGRIKSKNGIITTRPYTYSSTKMIHAQPGDLVISKLGLLGGCCSVVPEDFVTGIATTSDYLILRPKNFPKDAYYCYHYLRSPIFTHYAQSKTPKAILRRVSLSTIFEAPLIHVSESKRRKIVEKVDFYVESLDLSEKIISDIEKEIVQYVISISMRHDLSDEQKRALGWEKYSLGDVMKLDRQVVDLSPEINYPNLGVFSFAKGLFKKKDLNHLNCKATKLFKVKRGQIVYSRLFAFERAYGLVTDEFDSHFVSGEFPSFTIDLEKCEPEYVWAYLQDQVIWEFLKKKYSKGLGYRRQRIKAEAFGELEIWLPSKSDQPDVNSLFGMYTKMNQICKELIDEMAAFMPSVLSKTFDLPHN